MYNKKYDYYFEKMNYRKLKVSAQKGGTNTLRYFNKYEGP